MKRRAFLVLIALSVLCAVTVNFIGCDLILRDAETSESDAPVQSEKASEGESRVESDTVGSLEIESETFGEVRNDEPIEPDDGDNARVSDFAIRLFKASNEDGKNTLVSPLSVLCALSMTANGADGETREQMETVLGMSVEDYNAYLLAYLSSLPQGEKYKLSLANSIWFKEKEGLSVKEDFLRINEEYYGADIFKAKFDGQTLNDINGWVNDKTDGMIPEVLDEIPDEAIMYLINALAFDAEWAAQYKEYSVRDGSFTKEDGTTVSVQMMHGDDGRYIEDENATGFVKFYSGIKYAFVALLPNEDIDVSDYVSSLDGEHIQALLNGSRANLALYTSIPKFKVEYGVEMSEVLEGMGMVDALDSSKADFSRLGQSVDGNIYISRVIHKTFIEVGELGTRAGASTAIEMAEECAPEEIKQVYLDRPFVYMIVDWENKVPFFVGTMMDPGK